MHSEQWPAGSYRAHRAASQETKNTTTKKKNTKKRGKTAFRRVIVPISMLSNLSSRWGLSDNTMHARSVVLVFQR